ncbi:hypothetical protein GCM10027162_42270 [Streptomyces incanus]
MGQAGGPGGSGGGSWGLGCQEFPFQYHRPSGDIGGRLLSNAISFLPPCSADVLNDATGSGDVVGNEEMRDRGSVTAHLGSGSDRCGGLRI